MVLKREEEVLKKASGRNDVAAWGVLYWKGFMERWAAAADSSWEGEERGKKRRSYELLSALGKIGQQLNLVLGFFTLDAFLALSKI